MATWTQSQTNTAAEQPYASFFRALLGEASEAEIEERYVALARTILGGERCDHSDT
jgi:hypothetical protein